MTEPSVPECCSTPRCTDPLINPVSSVESDESEADIIEKSIRSSISNVNLKQLTHEIETTSVLGGLIMHTAESPSQQRLYYPQAADNYPVPPAPTEIIQENTHHSKPDHSLKPSAPTLQDIHSKEHVNLMDVSQYDTDNRSLSYPSGAQYLGKRSQTMVGFSEDAKSPATINTDIPQEPLNISLSPITSPVTSLLLQTPVHWYYSCPDGSWNPFSYLDSAAIEVAYTQAEGGQCTSLSTGGGRYDVNLAARQRTPVYWTGPSSAIRRCSWFYRSINDIMQPFDEDKSRILEENYSTAVKLRNFPTHVELGNGEVVTINSQSMMVLKSTPTKQGTPTLVRRGVPHNDKIPPDEKETADHLIFVLHGVGSMGDTEQKSFVDCVSEMRRTSQGLITEHWDKLNFAKEETQRRIEFVPVQWHAALHSDTLGVDRNISKLTLPSIPMLRDFVNSTCVDVLFYTSPFYCRAIIEQCCSEMNRLYDKFMSRNPNFKGGVSIIGHSLGSVIAFDILLQQEAFTRSGDTEMGQKSPLNTSSTDCLLKSSPANHSDTQSGVVESPSDAKQRTRHSSYSYEKSRYNSACDTSGTGQPLVLAPALSFSPSHLFALGSPLGLFLTVRGVHSLGSNFSLPTCGHFFNIFHPYDPVAYRIEPMLVGGTSEPVIIPHHRGRKRMHKEITEQLSRLGVAVKNQISNRIQSFYGSTENCAEVTDDESQGECAEHVSYGALNGGERIDYELQESPLELINEYLFSLSSHSCYWSSEDTILMMIREICKLDGSRPSTLPLV